MRTCSECDLPAIARAGDRGRFPQWCEIHKALRVKAQQDSPTDICLDPDCIRPRRARGLCSTHYNQQHQPNRNAKVVMPCSGCGELMSKEPSRANRYGKLYCTQQCRDEYHWLELRASRKQVAIYTPVPLWHRVMTAIGADKQRPPRTWTVGTCPECGDSFTDVQPQTRFCSPGCSRRWHRTAWKTKTNRIVPPKVRAHVYERDNGICQLCLTPVDMTLTPSHPYGATLDHIICQSWTLIPDHSAPNLRLAHRMCNSIRGDERGGQRAA